MQHRVTFELNQTKIGPVHLSTLLFWFRVMKVKFQFLSVKSIIFLLEKIKVWPHKTVLLFEIFSEQTADRQFQQ